jgi:hemoglobin
MSVSLNPDSERLLDTAVDKFFDKVVTDPFLRLYFKNSDMASLKQRFRTYLAHALKDDEQSYPGPSMYQAHVGRGITDEASGSFLTLLKETLEEVGVAPALIDHIDAKLRPVRDVVEDPVVFKKAHTYKADSASDRPRTH